MNGDELAELARSSGFPRVSIYLPTHKVYPQTEQDPIRLSNALKEVERQLAHAGVRNVNELVENARQRATHSTFWRYQDHGLAVFIEEGNTRWLRLPTEVPEMTVVATRYHVLPLIDIFADRGRFHVLAVTRDKVRFFDGAERELDEVDIGSLPASLSDVKDRTNFEDNVGYHSRSRGNQVGGGGVPKYHALGESPEDYDDIELQNFVREIAKAVDGHLAEYVTPLVLAARPRLLGRLRQELRYRHVAASDLRRDPASMTDDELHALTWAIAVPLLRRDRDETRERLRARLDGAEISGSEDLQELFRATDEGRMATLLLSRGATIWGRFDEKNRTVTIAEEAGADNEDLLNLLALKTLAQGGEVISLPDDLADRTGLAAGLFRY